MSISQGEPPTVRIPARDHGIAEDAEPSLVAQALEGWNLMTEIVAETDLPLASLMSTGAMIAWAAFHERTADLLDRLDAQFGPGSGVTRSFQAELMEELRQCLSSPPPVFEPEWLVSRLEQAAARYDASRPDAGSDPPRWFGAMTDSIHRVFGQEPASDVPEAPTTQGEWRIIATVEQPNMIAHEGSLYCSASKRNWRKNVELKENTYQQIRRSSTPVAGVLPGHWITLTDKDSGNERDFNESEQIQFTISLKDTIDEPIIAFYHLNLDIGGKALPLVYEFISAHEDVIRSVAKEAVDLAKGLTVPPHLKPLIPTGLLDKIPDYILSTIMWALKKRVDATSLPGWIIQHTVVKAAGQPPVSIALLQSQGQPDATLAGTTRSGDTMRRAQNADVKAFSSQQVWARGRILDGATLPGTGTNEQRTIVPDELWKWVANTGHPLVWSDAWEQGQPSHAFRVLVPFSRPVSGKRKRRRTPQAYVAALRVEVYSREVSQLPDDRKIRKEYHVF